MHIVRVLTKLCLWNPRWGDYERSRGAADHLVTWDGLHMDLGDVAIKTQFWTGVSMDFAIAGTVNDSSR